MRPLHSSVILDAPSCSGRATERFRHVGSRSIGRRTRVIVFNANGQVKTQSASLRLSFVETSAQADGNTTGERSSPPQISLVTSRPSKRDADGMLIVGRRKPLKINLDLALYRARQTRIRAFSASDIKERSRLLRESEAALRRCLELDPEDGRAYVSLGKLLVGQKRFDEALALYESGSTATGGTNAHIWTAWAYLAAKQGNVSLARRLYDAALVAAPTHAAAYHGWGLLEKAQGNFVRARDLWTKGIDATKNDPNPYLYQSLAVLASELDFIDEARRWFKAGTRTVKGSASHALWHAWAMMEQRVGNDAEVIRALFKKGQKASPRSRYLFLSWALWEKEQGNIVEARKLFRTGAYLNPRDAAVLQAWAILEEEAGDFAASRKLFQRGSRADPSHLYIWQAWGCMELRQDNLEAAREVFQQGVWAAPARAKDAALIFQAWAVLETKAGNIGLARELFKCAVKADPKSETSWMSWAAMEEDLGALERANELRNFSMQERQEVIRPMNFTTLPKNREQNVLEPVMKLLTKWFQRYEDSAPLPVLKTIDESDSDELVLPVAVNGRSKNNNNNKERDSDGGRKNTTSSAVVDKAEV